MAFLNEKIQVAKTTVAPVVDNVRQHLSGATKTVNKNFIIIKQSAHEHAQTKIEICKPYALAAGRFVVNCAKQFYEAVTRPRDFTRQIKLSIAGGGQELPV